MPKSAHLPRGCLRPPRRPRRSLLYPRADSEVAAILSEATAAAFRSPSPAPAPASPEAACPSAAGSSRWRIQPPRNPPRPRHRRRRSPPPRRPRRRPRLRPVLSARPHRDRLLHRRQHRLQRQRLAQLPLRRHRRLVVTPPRRARRWPHPRYPPRRAHRFRPRHRPLPRRHQKHRRLPPPPRHGLGRSLRRQRRHPRRRHRGHPAPAPRPQSVLAGVVFFPSDDTAARRRRALARYLHRPHARILRRALARPAPHTLPRHPQAARAAILFDQELESEDDPEVDRWLERLEGTGALTRGLLVRHHRQRSRTLPPLPPRPARNWSTTPSAAPAP